MFKTLLSELDTSELLPFMVGSYKRFSLCTEFIKFTTVVRNYAHKMHTTSFLSKVWSKTGVIEFGLNVTVALLLLADFVFVFSLKGICRSDLHEREAYSTADSTLNRRASLVVFIQYKDKPARLLV